MEKCFYCKGKKERVFNYTQEKASSNCGKCSGSGVTSWSSDFIGECDCFVSCGQKSWFLLCGQCGDMTEDTGRKITQNRVRAHLRLMVIKKDKKIIERLESLFVTGMGWGNRKEWHIDHIKPLKIFLDEGVTDYNIINHSSNLQPLWAKDNLAKGAKY